MLEYSRKSIICISRIQKKLLTEIKFINQFIDNRNMRRDIELE